MMQGIFAVYKPKGMTSHDVVAQIRKATGVKRVGHGGTLDPLATGVLVIAVGRENTKQLDQYVKGDKEYIATIKLGEVSETDDSEGPISSYLPVISNESERPQLQTSHSGDSSRLLRNDKKISPPIPSLPDIVRSSQKFVGIFPQIPPQYSAKKVGGKVAYKEVRKGRTLTLEPKNVEIMEIEIVEYTYPILKIRVKTGGGVYIRSLARDIGRDLGTGAYLADLERIRVGKFTKDDCITLEQM